MIEPIFTTPRKGYLGQRPMGAEYMAGVEARAKMLRRATRLGDDDPQDDRQLRLPLGVTDAEGGKGPAEKPVCSAP